MCLNRLGCGRKTFSENDRQGARGRAGLAVGRGRGFGYLKNEEGKVILC